LVEVNEYFRQLGNSVFFRFVTFDNEAIQKLDFVLIAFIF